MKKISALALIAALAAGGYTAASAQDAGVDAGVGVGVEAGDDVGVDAGVDAGEDGVGADAGADVGDDNANAGGDAAAQGAVGVEADALDLAVEYTYDDVRGALEGVADLDFSMVTDDTEIQVVPISDISGDDDATAFITGEADLAGPISETQTAIQGNAQIEAALQEGGYTADQVIAVYVESDTSIVIFVDDAAEG